MKRFLPLSIALFVTVAAAAPFKIPNDEASIVHALNRIAFGARPGDVEKVRSMGLERYIEQQLNPDRVPDPGMAPRLAGMMTLGMSSREIAEQYARPALEARREKKQDQVNATGDQPPQPSPEQRQMQQQAALVMLELSQQKMLRAVYSERQLEEVLADFWFNHFNVDSRKGPDRFMLTEYERETIRPHVFGKFRDLLGATAKSPAMLFYLDNWMSADPNGPHRVNRALTPVGRPGGGRGVRPRMPQAGARPQQQRRQMPQGGARPQMPPDGVRPQQQRRGLNENYARELMELHTLGVDGGYTQKDVTEVARAFTGWTIDQPRQGGDYRFDPRVHDPEQKVVLGHTIKAGGGESDGEAVLDLLAKHPSTATFIATKLARRFVSDTPPPALVDRAAKRFRETDGDLREVVRTIITSPEFFAPAARGVKVKTPLEFVVSAVRTSGRDVPNAQQLVRAVQQLGMPLYQCQPPTGYKDTADAWVNTGGLVSRMNFALQLARNDQALASKLGSPEFQKK